MNFGKLLGAGKSFVNGGKVTAYREDKRIYLPKFVSAKNPFTSKTAEEKTTAPEPSKITAAPKVNVPVAVKKQEVSTSSVQRPIRATNWAEKLNPFRVAQPPTPMPTVQPELSLDTVKVIHNDLKTADVEIVPVKSRTNSSAEAVTLPPPRDAWEFLGERLLKTV
jgi:hypothetical protein